MCRVKVGQAERILAAVDRVVRDDGVVVIARAIEPGRVVVCRVDRDGWIARCDGESATDALAQSMQVAEFEGDERAALAARGKAVQS